MDTILFILTIKSLKVGVGMSMEGIEQNPIVYDLMSEMAFQDNTVDVKVIYNNSKLAVLDVANCTLLSVVIPCLFLS